MSRLEIAPDTCPNCKGEGQLEAEYRGSGIVCSACGGRGYAWPDQLKADLYDAAHNASHRGDLTDCDKFWCQTYIPPMVDAMLGVLWEVGNDN